MAGIDISLLGFVSNVIVFLLVFIGGWGVLRVVKPFKEAGESLYGILAFILAALIIMSRSAVAVILTATPWLLMVGFVAFFFMFMAMMLGAKEKDIFEGAGGYKGWIIFFVALIMIFAIGTAFGPGLLAKQPGTGTGAGTVAPTDNSSGGYPLDGKTVGTATSDYGTNVVFTIFHPKILGVLFIFLLGTLTIIMLQK